MSDLHIINYSKYVHTQFLKEIKTDADVLILAGDIVSLSSREFEWSKARLQEFCDMYENVIYIAGNHEYYGTTIEYGKSILKEFNSSIRNLHARTSDYGVLELNKYSFFGSTGFQPYDVDADEISDHRAIHDFIPEAENEFESFMSNSDVINKDTVVISHHCPSNKSLDPQYAGATTNRWFITPEFESIILNKQPRLWVHGHTHTPFRYHIGNTEVVCNPRGYPGEGVNFNPRLVIEL